MLSVADHCLRRLFNMRPGLGLIFYINGKSGLNLLPFVLDIDSYAKHQTPVFVTHNLSPEEGSRTL
jgi:hypothetical protein